jgi:hypothetical protein
VFDLSLVGFAGRNDAHGVMTRGVNQHKQALLNHAHQLVTFLAIAVSGVGAHNPAGVKKRPRGISEIKSALCETAFTFVVVSFKIHR